MARFAAMRSLALAILMVLSAGVLAGCETRYIARAAYEESLLLWRRKPIDAVLARGDLPPQFRARLQTVLKVRAFASDRLGLNVGDAYTSISEVDKGAIAWVVMAAPRDSLEPYTWWFPIVGRIPYRGYFNKEHADAEAAEMEQRGYDTMVRPAVAFSSLGFFNDPLLSNLLRLDRVELAGVIIHELFHRTYFLASDVMFDESAATYVGSAGAIKFFEATEGPDSADAESARAVLDADLKFARFLNDEAGRLVQLYQSGLPRKEILKRRVTLFAAINADYAKLKPHLSGLERFDLDKQPINNAVLINYLIYFHDLDSFAKLDHIYAGNLHDTIKAIIALAESDRDNPFEPIERATRVGPLHAISRSGDPQSPPAVVSSSAPASSAAR
ncbi:MAG: aminopeptidase [Candidatus Binataceae bacterium]